MPRSHFADLVLAADWQKTKAEQKLAPKVKNKTVIFISSTAEPRKRNNAVQEISTTIYVPAN